MVPDGLRLERLLFLPYMEVHLISMVRDLPLCGKDYKPAEGLSKKKERERLIEQEYKEADSHVWNIIAAMGNGMREDGVALCFDHTSWDGDDNWNYKDLIMDDGQTWNEGIRYPAYQDVYFTYPFHNLFFEAYNYSFEDLCNINDFRVNVEVKLETKEQSRR